ncbi:cysteine dioxygenase family protein [Bordetella trematum]|uniref:cysteine dioxygenase family protein n=1 Tax=Bordetella trematum TaxID=123899 RepID=UPI000DA020D8|nr:cysteine dioxygenase [Bordetella trematum]SPU53989.1 Predicted metal-dependent enzyme of the double-stranded beta helix superfamily [Bordetella trematum]VDH06486.1 Predicted metal-dependent enzyme of the double-stranded beta helix superfamily [Bordetella trematum]
MTAHRLNDFIDRLRQQIAEAGGDEARLLASVEPLMQALVRHDDWLPERFAQPHPQYYQQYCLYACPRGDFSIVSFVWGPGQKTPVHDHTVWGVIGMLRGAELSEQFEPQAGGGYTITDRQTLQPGMTACVSPSIGDIHRVSNVFDDRVSISIHVYGADIGKVERHVYDPASGERKRFVSGYAPVQAA